MALTMNIILGPRSDECFHGRTEGSEQHCKVCRKPEGAKCAGKTGHEIRWGSRIGPGRLWNVNRFLNKHVEHLEIYGNGRRK